VLQRECCKGSVAKGVLQIHSGVGCWGRAQRTLPEKGRGGGDVTRRNVGVGEIITMGRGCIVITYADLSALGLQGIM
jgi:hypothetical protein